MMLGLAPLFSQHRMLLFVGLKQGAGGKDEDNDVLAWLSSKGVLTPDIEGAFASFAISTKQDLAIMLEDGYLTMQTLLQAGVPMAPAAKLLRALKDWKGGDK